MREATRNVLLLVVVSVLVLALSASGQDSSPTEALQAFGTVQKVLQHPRCQNCHIPGDAPLQFDDRRVHGQNVKRGKNGMGSAGLHCNTCHGTENPPASYGPHMPPGAHGWRLPSAQHKMVFIGVSGGELCRQLKDKAENGGRDLAALRHHLDDELVVWGWQPGVGRAPVDIPHDQFIAAFEQWAKAGAPCPAP